MATRKDKKEITQAVGRGAGTMAALTAASKLSKKKGLSTGKAIAAIVGGSVAGHQVSGAAYEGVAGYKKAKKSGKSTKESIKSGATKAGVALVGAKGVRAGKKAVAKTKEMAGKVAEKAKSVRDKIKDKLKKKGD